MTSIIELLIVGAIVIAIGCPIVIAYDKAKKDLNAYDKAKKDVNE